MDKLNSKTGINIKIVEFRDGRYFVNEHNEVYVYPHLGFRPYLIKAKSMPDELPDLCEIIKYALPKLIKDLRDKFPRQYIKTNGLIITGGITGSITELVRNGEDRVTLEDFSEIAILPCRYTLSDNQKKSILNDKSMFGDIF